MFDNEDSESYENYNQKLNADIGRFEKMILAHEHYYFDADALMGMIEYHQSNNQLNKAEEVLRFALKLHPNDFELRLKHAEFISLDGNHAEALNLLEELEKKHPGEIELYILKGNIYLDIEQYQQAIDYFEVAVDYADIPEDIYVNLAYAYRQLNNLTKAEDCILKAWDYTMDGVMVAEEFVDFFFITNQAERGIKKAEELIDNDPYDVLAWYALGNLHLRTLNFEKAIEALEYCLVIDENFLNAILQLAAAYYGQEQFEKAIELYKNTLRFSMLESYTQFCIGDCYAKLGQWNEARLYFRKSAKSNPDFSDAFYGIALTYSGQLRWQEAAHYIRKAIDLNKNVSNYFALAGQCEFQITRYEAAYGNFREAIRLDSKNLSGWYCFLDFLIERGEYEEALTECVFAIADNRNDAALHFRLVCYLFLNNRMKDAYNIFEKALQMDRHGYPLVFSICPQLQNDRHLNELIANLGPE
jgi:tetratricopeptide (TPR) repeat protein